MHINVTSMSVRSGEYSCFHLTTLHHLQNKVRLSRTSERFGNISHDALLLQVLEVGQHEFEPGDCHSRWNVKRERSSDGQLHTSLCVGVQSHLSCGKWVSVSPEVRRGRSWTASRVRGPTTHGNGRTGHETPKVTQMRWVGRKTKLKIWLADWSTIGSAELLPARQISHKFKCKLRSAAAKWRGFTTRNTAFAFWRWQTQGIATVRCAMSPRGTYRRRDGFFPPEINPKNQTPWDI